MTASNEKVPHHTLPEGKSVLLTFLALIWGTSLILIGAGVDPYLTVLISTAIITVSLFVADAHYERHEAFSARINMAAGIAMLGSIIIAIAFTL